MTSSKSKPCAIRCVLALICLFNLSNVSSALFQQTIFPLGQLQQSVTHHFKQPVTAETSNTKSLASAEAGLALKFNDDCNKEYATDHIEPIATPESSNSTAEMKKAPVKKRNCCCCCRMFVVFYFLFFCFSFKKVNDFL